MFGVMQSPPAQLSPAVLLVAMLVGCVTSPDAQWTSTQTAPPDFALALTITATDATPRAKHRRHAHYVLEPDGTFRAALGPGTRDGLLPPVTARLDPAEIGEIWRLTAPLLPPTPIATTAMAGEIQIQTTVTAHRRTTRGQFQPEAGDPLLRRLAELRGDRPDRP
ncbi:MAG: hypothetical protein AAF916_12490 [Planctomycetota bacterium]